MRNRLRARVKAGNAMGSLVADVLRLAWGALAPPPSSPPAHAHGPPPAPAKPAHVEEKGYVVQPSAERCAVDGSALEPVTGPWRWCPGCQRRVLVRPDP